MFLSLFHATDIGISGVPSVYGYLAQEHGIYNLRYMLHFSLSLSLSLVKQVFLDLSVSLVLPLSLSRSTGRMVQPSPTLKPPVLKPKFCLPTTLGGPTVIKGSFIHPTIEIYPNLSNQSEAASWQTSQSDIYSGCP